MVLGLDLFNELLKPNHIRDARLSHSVFLATHMIETPNGKFK